MKNANMNTQRTPGEELDKILNSITKDGENGAISRKSDKASKHIASSPDTLSEDTVNKIETLVGYLESMYKDLDFVKQQTSYHFMPALIEEVKQWLNEN